jgi:hypothetical protein
MMRIKNICNFIEGPQKMTVLDIFNSVWLHGVATAVSDAPPAAFCTHGLKKTLGLGTISCILDIRLDF